MTAATVPTEAEMQTAEDLIGTLATATAVLTAAIDARSNPYLFEGAAMIIERRSRRPKPSEAPWLD